MNLSFRSFCLRAPTLVSWALHAAEGVSDMALAFPSLFWAHSSSSRLSLSHIPKKKKTSRYVLLGTTNITWKNNWCLLNKNADRNWQGKPNQKLENSARNQTKVQGKLRVYDYRLKIWYPVQNVRSILTYYRGRWHMGLIHEKKNTNQDQLKTINYTH